MYAGVDGVMTSEKILPHFLVEISREITERLIPGIVWPWNTSANYHTGEMDGESEYYRCYLDEDFILVFMHTKGAMKTQYVFKMIK